MKLIYAARFSGLPIDLEIWKHGEYYILYDNEGASFSKYGENIMNIYNRIINEWKERNNHV